MRVLVACEFSGRVRDAFIAKGHDAVSCDLLDTESPGPHIKGDVIDYLDDGWELLIAFPPCTYLSKAGSRMYPLRIKEQSIALGFVLDLMESGIPRVCVENPVGLISTHIRKPDQIVSPHMFGEPIRKDTCLWLTNLPKLVPTSIVAPAGFVWVETINTKNRAHERSKTFLSIANAMAEQWG